MCEYCGCQSVTAIEELTREHDEVVNLISAIRSTADTNRMAALTREITTVLTPHTEVEEHGLFPLLANDFPDQIGTLESEHRQVEAVLAESAHETPADPAWPTRLIETLDLLRDHILKEQDGVFPAALTTLTGTDWDTVDKVRAKQGS
ncbi:hemerythrin domain-containing protein [Actinoplanes sp. NPDC000266]